MANLILVRHGTSDWNKLGKWTGLTDVELAAEGIEEARRMGETIRDITVDKVHVSTLKRAQQTFDEIQKVLSSVITVCTPEKINGRCEMSSAKKRSIALDEAGTQWYSRARISKTYTAASFPIMKRTFSRSCSKVITFLSLLTGIHFGHS